METIKNIWATNKDVRVFVWTVFNAAIALIGTYLVNPEYAMYSPFLIPILNMITKWVNNKYFGDLGTPDKQKEEIVNTVLENNPT